MQRSGGRELRYWLPPPVCPVQRDRLRPPPPAGFKGHSIKFAQKESLRTELRTVYVHMYIDMKDNARQMHTPKAASDFQRKN